MKKLRTAFASAIAATALLLLIGPGAPTEAAPNDGVLVDVIIGFNAAPGASEEALIHGLGGRMTHRYSVVHGMSASVPEAAIKALRNNPNVAAVDLDGQAQAIDAELDSSWGVKHIGSGQVHDAANTGAGISLAVIDTGIGNGTATPHPDLAVAGGYDFVDGDSSPQDGYGHGTHVAGSACALDNGVGVVGVAPDCVLYNLRVLDNGGSGSWSNILAAVDWAATNGIQVANLSLGGSQYPGSTVENGFNNAAAGGLVIVAAAGNSGNRRGNNDSVGYPARFSGVIAVAATDSSNSRASFSSTGPDVEISAPGVSVYSTVPTGSCSMCSSGGYRSASGTSMASPHVAGVAALMIAAGVPNVRTQLSATAIPLGSAWQYGVGLVDAPGAVNLGVAPPPQPTIGEVSGVVTEAGTGTPIQGASVSLDASTVTSTATDGSYSFANVPTGVHSVTAAAGGYIAVTANVTVEAGQTAVANIELAVEPPPPPPPEPSGLQVTSIDYSTTGGKNSDRHLVISVVVGDDSGPVEGVTVAMILYLDGAEYGSATAITGTDGLASFRVSNAPSGNYRTDVVSLNGGPDLNWPDEDVIYIR